MSVESPSTLRDTPAEDPPSSGRGGRTRTYTSTRTPFRSSGGSARVASGPTAPMWPAPFEEGLSAGAPSEREPLRAPGDPVRRPDATPWRMRATALTTPSVPPMRWRARACTEGEGPGDEPDEEDAADGGDRIPRGEPADDGTKTDMLRADLRPLSSWAPAVPSPSALPCDARRTTSLPGITGAPGEPVPPPDGRRGTPIGLGESFDGIIVARRRDADSDMDRVI